MISFEWTFLSQKELKESHHPFQPTMTFSWNCVHNYALNVYIFKTERAGMRWTTWAVRSFSNFVLHMYNPVALCGENPPKCNVLFHLKKKKKVESVPRDL